MLIRLKNSANHFRSYNNSRWEPRVGRERHDVAGNGDAGPIRQQHQTGLAHGVDGVGDVQIVREALDEILPRVLNASAQYPLPKPPQDPIALLAGHGHWEQSGSCSVNLDVDETFTRTGD